MSGCRGVAVGYPRTQQHAAQEEGQGLRSAASVRAPLAAAARDCCPALGELAVSLAYTPGPG